MHSWHPVLSSIPMAILNTKVIRDDVCMGTTCGRVFELCGRTYRFKYTCLPGNALTTKTRGASESRFDNRGQIRGQGQAEYSAGLPLCIAAYIDVCGLDPRQSCPPHCCALWNTPSFVWSYTYRSNSDGRHNGSYSPSEELCFLLDNDDELVRAASLDDTQSSTKKNIIHCLSVCIKSISLIIININTTHSRPVRTTNQPANQPGKRSMHRKMNMMHPSAPRVNQV